MPFETSTKASMSLARELRTGNLPLSQCDRCMGPLTNGCLHNASSCPLHSQQVPHAGHSSTRLYAIQIQAHLKGPLQLFARKVCCIALPLLDLEYPLVSNGNSLLCTQLHAWSRPSLGTANVYPALDHRRIHRLDSPCHSLSSASSALPEHAS